MSVGEVSADKISVDEMTVVENMNQLSFLSPVNELSVMSCRSMSYHPTI